MPARRSLLGGDHRAGLALVAEADGDTESAFQTLQGAGVGTSRLADPYVWLDAHILDAMCDLGGRHGHPETPMWVDTLRDLAARTGMRELTVRALLYSAAQGRRGDAEAVDLLAAQIDNPELHAVVGERRD